MGGKFPKDGQLLTEGPQTLTHAALIGHLN